MKVIILNNKEIAIQSDTGTQIVLTRDEGYVVLRQLDQKLLELAIRTSPRLKRPRRWKPINIDIPSKPASRPSELKLARSRS